MCWRRHSTSTFYPTIKYISMPNVSKNIYFLNNLLKKNHFGTFKKIITLWMAWEITAIVKIIVKICFMSLLAGNFFWSLWLAVNCVLCERYINFDIFINIYIYTPKLRYNESQYSEFCDLVNKCQLPVLLTKSRYSKFGI